MVEEERKGARQHQLVEDVARNVAALVLHGVNRVVEYLHVDHVVNRGEEYPGLDDGKASRRRGAQAAAWKARREREGCVGRACEDARTSFYAKGLGTLRTAL